MKRIVEFITSEGLKNKGEMVLGLITCVVFCGFLGINSAMNDPSIILGAFMSFVSQICIAYLYFFIGEESIKGFKKEIYYQKKQKNSLYRVIGDDSSVLKKCNF